MASTLKELEPKEKIQKDLSYQVVEGYDQKRVEIWQEEAFD